MNGLREDKKGHEDLRIKGQYMTMKELERLLQVDSRQHGGFEKWWADQDWHPRDKTPAELFGNFILLRRIPRSLLRV